MFCRSGYHLPNYAEGPFLDVTPGGGGRKIPFALMERLIPPVIVEVNRGVGGVFNEYDFGLRVEVEVVAGGKASDQYTPFYHR